MDSVHQDGPWGTLEGDPIGGLNAPPPHPALVGGAASAALVPSLLPLSTNPSPPSLSPKKEGLAYACRENRSLLLT